MSDPINPDHYQGFSYGSEVIDITENLNFCRGNAIKYIARAGRKAGNDELIELEKARWYIEREISRIERGREDTGSEGGDSFPSAFAERLRKAQEDGLIVRRDGAL